MTTLTIMRQLLVNKSLDVQAAFSICHALYPVPILSPFLFITILWLVRVRVRTRAIAEAAYHVRSQAVITYDVIVFSEELAQIIQAGWGSLSRD